MRDRGRSQRAVRLTLLVASIAIAAGGVEVVLRTFYPVGAIVYRFNEEYFQEYRPDTRKVFQRLPVNGGDRIMVSINSYGFRGSDFAVGRSDSTIRVIVYGDSYVAAEFTAQEDTFSEQLESHLALGLNREVEVLNAGIIGFGPDQVARRLPADLEALQPDLVIVCISAHNDFGDLVRNRLYRLDERGALVDNAYRISDTLRRAFRQNAASQLALAGLLRAGWRGVAQRLFSDTMPTTGDAPTGSRLEGELRVVQAEFERFVVQGNQDVESVLVDRYDADVSLLPGSASATYKTALMGVTIGRLSELVDAAGTALFVVVIPSPFVIDDYDGIHVDRTLFPSYAPDGPTTAVAAAAQAHHVEHADLFYLFAPYDPLTLYFRQDTHWSDRGQLIAGQVVAQRIISLGMLP